MKNPTSSVSPARRGVSPARRGVSPARREAGRYLQMMQGRRRLVLALLLACVGLGLGALAVYAHAEYERSEPPAGAVIPEAPDEVHVWFTQELFRRAGANTLEVVGPDGARVDKEDARIDDDDRTHMIVSLQGDLPAGAYTVRWQSLSADDGDADSGEFGFAVDPAASPPQASGAPQPVATPSAPAVAPTPAPPGQGTQELPSQERGGLPCLGGFLGAAALVAFGGLRWIGAH